MRIQVLFSFLCIISMTQATAQNNSFITDETRPSNLSYSSVSMFAEVSGITSGAGLKYSSSNMLNKNNKFSIGPAVFVERVILPHYLEDLNTKKTLITLLSPGLNAKYHLHRSCFLQMDVSLLIGLETRVRIVPGSSGKSEEDRALSGLQLEQTFFYKKSGGRGIQLGIGIFERITDSDIYHSDLGAKIYLGFGW